MLKFIVKQDICFISLVVSWHLPFTRQCSDAFQV